ncbi:MAG: hypothetical protein QOC63_1413 [Mycobacterium sp.]|nr:hypothetical protein [Mycobacterium sp.]
MAVVSWNLMSSPRVCLIVAAAAWAALLAIGVPAATAAPTTDSQGYLDSTARCTPPDTAVAFGSTETSRMAICKTAGGQYEYRGVRVRDGATLTVPASQSGNGYVADNDGITYTVTSKSLVVTVGNTVIREEPMADFHTPGSATGPAGTTPGTSTTSTSTSGTSGTSGTTTSGTSSGPPTTTSTTPLPPPLPAEVGGGGH